MTGISSNAATLTWDANGSAVGTGGTGNWNTTSALWTADGVNYVDWSSGSAAVFNATAGTVTVTAPVNAGALTFNAAYTLTGSSVLTLSGTPTVNTGGFNIADTMSAATLALSGTSTINKIGVGTLTLTNDQSGSLPNATIWNASGGSLNTSSGLYNSTIALGDGKELGPSTGSVLNLNGATLAFTSSTDTAGFYSARTINVGASGGAVFDGGFAPGEASGGNTISPTVTIASGPGLNLVANDLLEFDAGNGGTGAGIISGAGGITVYGTGVAEILSTANTYTGGTNISSGSTLVIGGAGSIGSGNLSVSGSLNLSGASLSVKQFTSNSGTINFNISSASTVNKITATSAVMSGTTLIGIANTSSSTFAAGTYPLITSTAGGLSGAVAFSIAGGENLTIPINAEIKTVGSTKYRLTLATTGSAVNLISTPAPAHAIAVMPLGSSITEGISAQSPYDGGGYRSQLYQHLVNDGRFTPTFVGSATTTGSNNATGLDLMTAVGQPNHEGHSGYTTSQVVANLNGNDSSGGNDGGYWLATGNGVNPDYITLNIGGNDFVDGQQGTNGATSQSNLNNILTQIATLRPNATVIVSTILYRGDGGGVYATGANGFENTYNPYMPGIVYQHVLAGQHVSFIDMNSIVTPNNSLALIGPDLVHPTQAGYDLMADAWYTSLTTGQAFYTGNAGSTWNANGSGGTTSWDLDFQRTTDAGVTPSSGTDVYFNGVGGATTLGANTSVRSVNFTSAQTTSVTIVGPSTLTLGQGGITVQAGTGAHTLSAPVVVGTSQTWSNVSTNPFTVNGTVSGSSTLTIGGSGVIVLAGSNSFTGATNISSGTLDLANANALANSTVTLSTGGITFDQSVASNAFTLGGLAGSTPIVLTNNAASAAPIALTVGTDNASTTYSGQIAGTGSLTKVGTGTLTLSSSGGGISSNYNYSGGLTIDGGIVSAVSISGIGVGGNAGNPTVATVAINNAELDFPITANPLVSTVTLSLGTGNDVIGILTSTTTWNVSAGVIGTGTLVKSGAGTLLLGGSGNTYSGGTSVTQGTLTGAAGGAFGTGDLLINPTATTGTAADAATVNYNTSGALASTANVTINSNSATATGLLNINSATAAVGSLSGNGTVALLNNPSTVLAVGNASNDVFTGTISQASGTSGSLIKTGSGNLTLNGVNTYSGTTTVSQGTLTAGSSSALGSSVVTLANGTVLALGLNTTAVPSTGVILSNTVTIAPAAAATLQLAPTALYSSGGVGAITIGAGSTATVSIGANASSGVTHGLLKTPSVTFTNISSGTLNVGRNDLDISSQSLAAVTAMVATACNAPGGNWTGPGITSSVAAADPAQLTGLGVITDISGGATLYGVNGTIATTFDGIQPQPNDILVKYTYYGDANLDGTVDGSDYSLIDNGYLNQLTGWYNGDFNYDGIVDGSDYTLIDNAFNTQGANRAVLISTGDLASPTSQISGSSAVPEPAMPTVVGLGGVFLLCRRRIAPPKRIFFAKF